MLATLDDIGKGMPYIKASKKYGVPRVTLMYKAKLGPPTI